MFLVSWKIGCLAIPSVAICGKQQKERQTPDSVLTATMLRCRVLNATTKHAASIISRDLAGRLSLGRA